MECISRSYPPRYRGTRPCANSQLSSRHRHRCPPWQRMRPSNSSEGSFFASGDCWRSFADVPRRGSASLQASGVKSCTPTGCLKIHSALMRPFGRCEAICGNAKTLSLERPPASADWPDLHLHGGVGKAEQGWSRFPHPRPIQHRILFGSGRKPIPGGRPGTALHVFHRRGHGELLERAPVFDVGSTAPRRVRCGSRKCSTISITTTRSPRETRRFPLISRRLHVLGSGNTAWCGSGSKAATKAATGPSSFNCWIKRASCNKAPATSVPLLANQGPVQLRGMFGDGGPTKFFFRTPTTRLAHLFAKRGICHQFVDPAGQIAGKLIGI